MNDTNWNGEYDSRGGQDLRPVAPAKTQVFRVKVNGHTYEIEATSKDEARAIAYNLDQFHK